MPRHLAGVTMQIANLVNPHVDGKNSHVLYQMIGVINMYGMNYNILYNGTFNKCK